MVQKNFSEISKFYHPSYEILTIQPHAEKKSGALNKRWLIYSAFTIFFSDEFMPENIELSAESMGKIKQAVSDFRNTLETYFKENSVEVKDWKFAVESSESSYIIDASVKIQIKPKNKTK